MKLFQKLLLLTLGPLALSGAVLFVLFWFTSGIYLRQLAEREAGAQLGIEASRVGAVFQRVIAQARLVAAAPTVAYDDPPRVVEQLRATKARWPAIVGPLYFIDLEGTVHGSEEPLNLRGRDYYAQIERGEITITRAVWGTTHPIVVVFVPVFGARGGRLGAIGATVEVGDLLRELTEIRAGDTGFALLVDQRGFAISPVLGGVPGSMDQFFRAPETYAGRPGVNALTAAMRSSESGTVAITLDGAPCTAFFQSLSPAPWRLALVYQDRELFAARRELSLIAFFVLLVIGAVAASLAAAIGRLLVRPVDALHGALQAVASGDLQRRASVRSKDEIGELAASFNTMADRLESDATTIRAEMESRRHAEEALRQSERKLRGIFNQTFQLMGLLDTSGRLLEINETACRFAGVRPGDVVGLLFWETPWWTHSADEQARLRQAIARAADGEFVRYLTTHQDPQGAVHTIDFSLKPLFDDQGAITYLIPEGRDVTETARATEALRQMERQLRQSQKMEAIGTLAGGIAHDFNNLLTAILGNIEMVLGDMEPAHPRRPDLLDAQSAAIRARDLVKQILAFSRRQDMARHPVQLQPIVEEVLRLLRAATPPMIEIVSDFEEHLPPVAADPTQIHQVVMNLGTNATHALEDSGGRLEVAVGRVALTGHPVLPDGSYARLVVRDTGMGMSPEVRDRIFDPFFTTKPTGKGSGLGLSVVHGIVRDHGGSVTVESRPGGGSAFTVLLPFSEEAAIGDADRASPRATTRGLRVAVVDDEPMVADVARRLLARLGCQVLTFADPDVALQRLGDASLGVDVVITDRSMPKRTGLELARALHALRPALPIVLATGFADAAPRDLETSGIVRVLQKPFTEADLADVLQAAARGPD